MATGGSKSPQDMTLAEMILKLEELATPVVNDERQDKYCKIITKLLSYFGNERCLVAGSTQEKLRIRLNKDEGDFDYLIISGIRIPHECLEYNELLPCFFRIDGTKLRDQFPGFELVDEKYLPSSLLFDNRPEAFKHIRDIYKIVSRVGARKGDHRLHVYIDEHIKPGMTLVNYINASCPELKIKEEKSNTPTEKLLESFGQGIKVDVSSDLIKNVFNLIGNNKKKIPEMCSAIKSSSKLWGDSVHDDSSKSNPKTLQLNYEYKSSKDFIPAFPLIGKPKGLDDWMTRSKESHWPPLNVRRAIYESEFFVVAKPALVNGNRNIDFCFGYNMAELQLAKAMTKVQRKVLLAIKALQKSVLQQFSKKLTTFHWKTAVYWSSENIARAVCYWYYFELSWKKW